MSARFRSSRFLFAVLAVMWSAAPAVAADPAAEVMQESLGEPLAKLRNEHTWAPFWPEESVLTYLSDRSAIVELDATTEAIVLSNLAEACVHRAVGKESEDDAWKLAASCARPLATRAVQQFMAGNVDAPLPADTLVLTHFVITLAAADFAEKSTAWDDENHELLVRAADRLRSRLMADPDAIPTSFVERGERWPDHAVASIYAVWLADQVAPAEDNESRWKEPARRFTAWIAQRGLAGDWGLPIYEISGAFATSKVPRGSVLSSMVRYQSAWDPPAARRLWERYKALYLVRLPAVPGLREFPPAATFPADEASGSINAGIGSAATQIGVGAARLMGETATTALLTTPNSPLDSTGLPLPLEAEPPPPDLTAGGLRSAAIRTNLAAIKPWFGGKQ